MYNYSELQDLINNRLDSNGFKKQPTELYEPINYILSIGGKRLRPILVLMSCNMFDNDINKAIDGALAIETFHNLTLLHDDIMDNADTRRGNETVHKKWNANIAILSGDAMSILAYEFLSKTNIKYIKDVLNCFNQTALYVCEGQQYDMNFEALRNVSINDYIKMIRLKTAELIAGSLKIGAIIGNAKPIDVDLVYEFGVNIGLAFQLQDDLLDVYGDPKVFGKNIGGDIVANKKTYLLLKAFELAKGNVKDKLDALIFESYDNPDKKVIEVKEIYEELNIKNITEYLIDKYFDEGLACLQKINVENERKSQISTIINKLLKREY